MLDLGATQLCGFPFHTICPRGSWAWSILLSVPELPYRHPVSGHWGCSHQPECHGPNTLIHSRFFPSLHLLEITCSPIINRSFLEESLGTTMAHPKCPEQLKRTSMPKTKTSPSFIGGDCRGGRCGTVPQ